MTDFMRKPNTLDRLELLISRHLDGEISTADQAELDGLLVADADARALFEDYCDLDARAGAVLRADVKLSRGTVCVTQRSPWWTAFFTAVSAAAAVVALSLLFDNRGGRHAPHVRPFPNESNIAGGTPSGSMVAPFDYQSVDFQPSQRVGDWRRDLIGIRGRDPNVILIIEQATQTSGRVPIYGDF